MKKLIVILCAVALIGGAVTVFALSDSIGIAVSDDGIASRADLDKNVTLTVSGTAKAVTYDKSRAVSDGFADIYKDADGNDWIMKNGELTGFYNNTIDHPATDCEPIGQDTAVKIAVKFLANFTEYAGEYELKDFSEKSNYGQYYITLARKLGEIFTDESAEVWVMYDGAI